MNDRSSGASRRARFAGPVRAPGDYPRPGRSAATLFRNGAAALLACGLLAACGSDDSSDGGDSGAADEGGVASVEDFCASMDRINVHLDQSGHFKSAEDHDDVASALEAVQSIDAPEEITSQWATLIDGTKEATELEDSNDFEETAETEKAAERVLSYVDVQCSIELHSAPQSY